MRLCTLAKSGSFLVAYRGKLIIGFLIQPNDISIFQVITQSR